MGAGASSLSNPGIPGITLEDTGSQANLSETSNEACATSQVLGSIWDFTYKKILKNKEGFGYKEKIIENGRNKILIKWSFIY